MCGVLPACLQNDKSMHREFSINQLFHMCVLQTCYFYFAIPVISHRVYILLIIWFHDLQLQLVVNNVFKNMLTLSMICFGVSFCGAF